MTIPTTTPTPLDRFERAILDALKPDPQIWTDEWSEAHRILPPDVPEPGPYRNARTPYLIDIQRTMSPGSKYREGWFKKPVQVGGSVSGENLIASWICTAAGAILMVFPTLDDAKQWNLSRFEPMVDSTKELRKRIRPATEKNSKNAQLRKRFPGGTLRLVGANRAGGVKSATTRYIKFEEPDEYPAQVGGQGTVVGNAINRAINFGAKAKIFGDGTPTLESASEIDARFKTGDQRLWFMFCPHCQEKQVMKWAQVKWVNADPLTTRYECMHCNAQSTEEEWKLWNYRQRPKRCSEEKAGELKLAHWVATAVGRPRVASWHMNALAAPLNWRSWVDLVGMWLAAQGDERKLTEFTNNQLAEVWTATVNSKISAEALSARAEPYKLMSCPQAGLILVAAVDTQDNRLVVGIRAFGRGEESWGIWHGELFGDPARPDVWNRLTDLLETPVAHESGQVMRLDAVAVDAGGHHAEDVYAFCRGAQARGKHWFAVRGAKAYDAPKISRPKTMEFTWRGKPVLGGAVLRWVGTQSIKTVIHNRLELATGPGAYHFPLDYEPAYYSQLTAETREWRKDKAGHRALWWTNPSGVRNDYGDVEVYIYAALVYAMAGQYAESVWKRREAVYAVVVQRDWVDDQVPKEPAPDADEALEQVDRLAAGNAAQPERSSGSSTRRRAGGFAKNWG